MNGVLAVSIPLAEEAVSQTTSFGEGAGVSGVTQVHHLIDGEERLVASLLSFSEFLTRKQSRRSERWASLSCSKSFFLCVLYLHNVNQHLKISQQLPHIPVKYHQLCPLQRKRPVGIWSCNHGPLTSSKQPITGHLHIKRDTNE